MVVDKNITTIGQGYQALYHNIAVEQTQFAVVSGAAASNGSNDQEVDIASGTVIHDGNRVNVTAQTVALDPADPSDPRRDIVYIDGNGDAQTKSGTAAATPSKQGSLTDVFNYYNPAPPSMASTDGVVIAEFWQPAGASDWSDQNDLRIYADIAADTVDAETINATTTNSDTVDADTTDTDELKGVVTGNTSVTDLVGAGLEISSNTVQLMSSIWDSGNSNIIADVVNSVTNSDRIEFDDTAESTETISTASGTLDIDLSTANTWRIEATGDIDITFSNVTSSPDGNAVTIYAVDSDGNGPYTITWPSSVVWNEGSVISTVDQSSNVEISLLTDDAGTEWRGRKSGKGFN